MLCPGLPAGPVAVTVVIAATVVVILAPLVFKVTAAIVEIIIAAARPAAARAEGAAWRHEHDGNGRERVAASYQQPEARLDEITDCPARRCASDRRLPLRLLFFLK